MTIKVLCSCGSKFAFDIEPINGRMPAPVACPVCGADGTEAANQAIASQMAAAPSVSPAPIAVAPTQADAGAMRISAPAQPSSQAAPDASAGTWEPCGRHPQSAAAANCVVCNKPICLDCMAQFGFLCSVFCKEQARQQNISVPFYAGQKAAAEQKEDRKVRNVLLAAAAVLAVFMGLFAYYKLVASKPKVAFKLAATASAPFVFAEWISTEQFVTLTTEKLTLYEAGSGKVIWESAFKPDEKPERPRGIFGRGKEDAFDFISSSDVKAKLVGSDLWVFFPKRAVRFETASGKRKQEVPLLPDAQETSLGESAYLTIAEPNLATKIITRLDLASGQVQSVTSTQAVVHPFLARAATYRDPNEEPEPVFASSSRDVFLSGSSAIQMQNKLLEKRIGVKEEPKSKKPSVIDSGNLRASQSMEAAAEFINQSNSGPSYEDQSRYSVTLKRLLGGGSSWTGEIVGSPAFFPLRTLDVLAGGKMIIVFNKSGQKLWQAKLNYPIAPKFISGDEDNPPCLESGNRLYFFDLGNLTAFDAKKGDVDWRLESVGISEVNLDSRGKLYVSTTTAGPDQIRPSQNIVVNNRILPVIMKVDPSNGAVLWQVERLGERTYLSGKFLYAARAQVSGVDVFASISNNDDKGAPIHHRIYRLDPGKGKELWEYYKAQVPRLIEPKGNRILLQYKNEIQMLKFFSL